MDIQFQFIHDNTVHTLSVPEQRKPEQYLCEYLSEKQGVPSIEINPKAIHTHQGIPFYLVHIESIYAQLIDKLRKTMHDVDNEDRIYTDKEKKVVFDKLDELLEEQNEDTQKRVHIDLTEMCKHFQINHIKLSQLRNRHIQSLVIPDCVTHISYCIKPHPNDSNAIYGAACYGLPFESIVIPNGIVHIGMNAFAFCSELRSINIPNSVTHIDNNCFTGCYNLKSVEIPYHTYFAKDAFPPNCKVYIRKP